MINILVNKKTRTHRFSKLPDDGDPWAPNNLLTPEQTKSISWTPVGQATDKKLRPQPTKINRPKHTVSTVHDPQLYSTWPCTLIISLKYVYLSPHRALSQGKVEIEYLRLGEHIPPTTVRANGIMITCSCNILKELKYATH